LYKGKYLSQEVAVKVMELDDMNIENESGTLRTVPAVELLQMFKQEVSIMRYAENVSGRRMSNIKDWIMDACFMRRLQPTCMED
jgi:hypothetical protein